MTSVRIRVASVAKGMAVVLSATAAQLKGIDVPLPVSRYGMLVPSANSDIDGAERGQITAPRRTAKSTMGQLATGYELESHKVSRTDKLLTPWPITEQEAFGR